MRTGLIYIALSRSLGQKFSLSRNKSTRGFMWLRARQRNRLGKSRRRRQSRHSSSSTDRQHLRNREARGRGRSYIKVMDNRVGRMAKDKRQEADIQEVEVERRVHDEGPMGCARVMMGVDGVRVGVVIVGMGCGDRLRSRQLAGLGRDGRKQQPNNNRSSSIESWYRFNKAAGLLCQILIVCVFSIANQSSHHQTHSVPHFTGQRPTILSLHFHLCAPLFG
jgi:hypothetical protein